MRTQHAMKHVIELDSVSYRLEGDQAILVEDLATVPGEKWLVTNFQEAVSRRLVVDGPSQYAEMLVQRKVQESGEFEEPVHIITHWKTKRGKNSTDIFFTAMPARVADYYFQVLRQQAELTLIVPVYSILLDVLRHSAGKAPQAVVLRHDRFAEVLVGDNRQVFFANRSVAFDTEPEQIQALWETIGSDLDEVEREHRIEVRRVLYLNWLDTEAEPLTGETWSRHLVPVNPMMLICDSASRPTSWPSVLSRLRIGLSASPPVDKALYLCRRLAPMFNLVLLAAVLLLSAGMLVFEQRAQATRRGVTDTEQQFRRVQTTPSDLSMPADFPEMIAFISQMDRQRRLPAYHQILGDVTRAGFEGLTMEQVTLDYSADSVAITLFAQVEAPFEQARAGFRKMVRQLKATGYSVMEQTFETRINASSLMLKLKRMAAA